MVLGLDIKNIRYQNADTSQKDIEMQTYDSYEWRSTN